MSREELLNRIDKRIELNMQRRGAYDCSFLDSIALGYNSELLKNIKTELQKQTDKTYEQGMRDIWGLFYKIYCDPGYNPAKLNQIFTYPYVDEILERLSPGEALFRMREYEDKKKKEAEKPVVGDVVDFTYKYGGHLAQTHRGILRGEDELSWYIIVSDIMVVRILSKREWDFKKTGKHVDIQGMLDELKE